MRGETGAFALIAFFYSGFICVAMYPSLTIAQQTPSRVNVDAGEINEESSQFSKVFASALGKCFFPAIEDSDVDPDSYVRIEIKSRVDGALEERPSLVEPKRANAEERRLFRLATDAVRACGKEAAGNRPAVILAEFTKSSIEIMSGDVESKEKFTLHRSTEKEEKHGHSGYSKDQEVNSRHEASESAITAKSGDADRQTTGAGATSATPTPESPNRSEGTGQDSDPPSVASATRAPENNVRTRDAISQGAPPSKDAEADVTDPDKAPAPSPGKEASLEAPASLDEPTAPTEGTRDFVEDEPPAAARAPSGTSEQPSDAEAMARLAKIRTRFDELVEIERRSRLSGDPATPEQLAELEALEGEVGTLVERSAIAHWRRRALAAYADVIHPEALAPLAGHVAASDAEPAIMIVRIPTYTYTAPDFAQSSGNTLDEGSHLLRLAEIEPDFVLAWVPGTGPSFIPMTSVVIYEEE